MTVRFVWLLLVLLLQLAPLTAARAQTGAVGVNLDNPQWLGPAQREAVLERLQTAGVRLLRLPLAPPYEAAVDFVREAGTRGMRVVLVVSTWDPRIYPADTPMRQPAGVPGMFPMPPLSRADPDRFKGFLAPYLGQIEAAGVTLAALELGNEINWAAFNGDFELPAEGRVLGLRDLDETTAGRRIAAGFRAYVGLLAALKDMRDQTRWNARTPIVSAGLADFGASGPLPAFKAQAVAIGATLKYLRAHGLDPLVEFYGVHTYPDISKPANVRARQLAAETFSECRAIPLGKPCWLTEWGLPVDSTTCPADDTRRETAVRETLDSLRPLVREGALAALLYYEWENDSDPLSIFRCGALTKSGRMVLEPVASEPADRQLGETRTRYPPTR